MRPPQHRIIRRPVHGVLLFNKPLGLSSNTALQKVRGLYRAAKGGHTGALDPLATGLLPLCFGEATKFSHYLLEAQKRYLTTVTLGAMTTTGDCEGEIVQTFAIPVLTQERINQVLQQFTGPILQVPPMYSALKKDGRPLYELARQGITVERIARPVTISDIKCTGFTETELYLDVTCSKGTYIRTLAEDIAQALGTGGYVSRLHRIETGPFKLNETITLEYLERLSESERDALLLPMYAAVEHLPRIYFEHGEDFYFNRGQAVMVNAPAGEALAFVQQHFLGLGVVDGERMFHPKRLMMHTPPTA